MVKSEHRIQSLASKPMPSPSLSSSSSSLSSSPPPPSSSSSCKKKYKGVRMRSWGSWVSEIGAPNQKTRIWLGSYSTAEAAARAYDAALLCLKGSSANLNFPDSAASFQPPHDSSLLMSPKSIQRVAAAAAANSFVDHPQYHHHHHNASTPSSPSDPSSFSSSSSSMASSPSMSSSSPLFEHQLIDDSISLTPPTLAGSAMDATYDIIDGFNASSSSSLSSSMMMVHEPWFDLSPKYMDSLMNSVFFNPASSMDIEEFYEEQDLPLWSFC